MKLKFNIPAQFGGGESAKHLMPYSIQLRKVFDANICSNYLKTIQEFCFILRVSGPITDFKGDGPESMRHVKKSHYIKIDLVIPESKWKDQSPKTIKQYFCEGITKCFYLMIERAEKNGELIDKQGLIDDFEKSMTVFRSAKQPPPHVSAHTKVFQQ